MTVVRWDSKDPGDLGKVLGILEDRKERRGWGRAFWEPEKLPEIVHRGAVSAL